MHKKVLDLDQVLGILRKRKSEFAATYGVTAIGVFGSLAKGEAKSDSDVDVVVQISKPDLFMLVGIKNDLEERLHRQVDIITYRENMNPFLKKRIDKEVVYA